MCKLLDYSLAQKKGIVMQNVRIGTCGICGGPVSTPAVWHGIIPPEKKCEWCGAHPQEELGPVLPMKEVRQGNIVEIRTTDNTASTKY